MVSRLNLISAGRAVTDCANARQGQFAAIGTDEQMFGAE
jgi:hypothetical protein